MSRDPHLFLEDIPESCAKIRRYTQGMTFEDFLRDEKTLDAVICNLTIIGEAVKRLPRDLKGKTSALQEVQNHE